MMKSNTFIIIISVIITFSACMKEETFIPVNDTYNFSFSDSSAQNPKDNQYQDLLDKYTGKGIPGIIALVFTPDDGLWIGASGYSCIENNTPMNKCNIVYSASIGKTYCAVSVMQLIDKGMLHMDDKINIYLDAGICDKLPNGNSATIKDLLGHTSGIPNFETGEDFIADMLNDPFSITTESLIEYEYDKKKLFDAGTDYKYSSTGYELLTIIIEKVTGEPHSNYYTTNIFQPAGLYHTYYKNEDGFPGPDGLVNCYFDRMGNGKIENVSEENNYLTQVLTGSDGIMASVYDYYLFINALVNGNLVSRESYQQMTEWRDTYSWTDSQYGLGLQKRKTKYGDKIGHDGDAMGAGADMYYFPDSGVFVVTATNLGTFLDTDLADLYNDDFLDEILNVIFM